MKIYVVISIFSLTCALDLEKRLYVAHLYEYDHFSVSYKNFVILCFVRKVYFFDKWYKLKCYPDIHKSVQHINFEKV